MTTQDIVIDALRELGVLNATDAPSGEDAALGLFRLNLLLDQWNGRREFVYADLYPTYTTTASLNPHTIGLSANSPTWTVTGNRPESIDDANIVLTSNIRYPLRIIRTSEEYFDLTARAVESSLPSALYYKPTWPNGSVYLYLVPDTALTIELRIRVVLAQLTLTSDFTLPPGYQAALTFSLAEVLATPFKVQLSPDTKEQARMARAELFGNNIEIPALQTCDSGLPSGRGGWFDYRSGEVR